MSLIQKFSPFLPYFVAVLFFSSFPLTEHAYFISCYSMVSGATRRSFSTGDGDTRLALLAADDAIENSLSSRLSSQRMAFQDASFLPLKEERGGAGGRTHEEGEEKCSQEEAHVLVRNISIGRHAGSSPTDFALARSVKPPFFHFLVVDDIASNRSIVSRLLLGLGHSVVEADDGEEAMLKFGQSLQPTGGAASEPPVSQFDCIFIDNVMPHKVDFVSVVGFACAASRPVLHLASCASRCLNCSIV